jgi:hypothetical protein
LLNNKLNKRHHAMQLLEHCDENTLKKLKINELYDIANHLHLSLDLQNLKGIEKRRVLISAIIKNKSLEKTKYQRYYVYPGHWFRNDYEYIKSDFHNVQCALCYKKTGFFKKQFNVCQDCHFILQKEFCRRYSQQYQLSCIITPHCDILTVIWSILKIIL